MREAEEKKMMTEKKTHERTRRGGLNEDGGRGGGGSFLGEKSGLTAGGNSRGQRVAHPLPPPLAGLPTGDECEELFIMDLYNEFKAEAK